MLSELNGNLPRETYHDRQVVMDTSRELEASLDFEGLIAQRLSCPAFSWNASKTMPVCDIFHVTTSSLEPKPSEDLDETLFRNDAGLCCAIEDGDVYSEKKLVSVVLAFQQWRHIYLKNMLGQEIRKVLEEAREEGSTLSALETELEETEQQLASARANSSKIRSQLAASLINNYHENVYSADNTTGSKSEMEMMRTMESLKEAEIEIQRRDNEIQQLNERIRCMDDRSGHVDGKLSCLQAETITLQAENRALLEQLSSRDLEVVKQAEEIEKLKAPTVKLVEQQKSKQQQQLESLMVGFSAEVKTLQYQLQHAREAKCSKEIELATAVKHCNHLKQEKDILLLLRPDTGKQAVLASAHAECISNDGEKVSEEVLSEMVEHLKKLTNHVRELESTVNAVDHLKPSSPHADESSARRKIVNTSESKNWCAEAGKCGTLKLDQVYCSSQDTDLGLLQSNYPLCPACTKVISHDQSHVSFSSISDHTLLNPSNIVHHSLSQHISQDKINSLIWRLQLAVSIARVEFLSSKLHSLDQNGLDDPRRVHKVQESIERLRTANLTACMKNELCTVVGDHKLVPLILSAWRAFTRVSVLEHKATSKGAYLDKMLKASLFWIQRGGKRRQLERSLLRWRVVTLSSNKQARSKQDTRNNSKNKIMKELHPSHEESIAPSKPPSTPTKHQRLPLESSDKTVASMQRRSVTTPAVTHHSIRQKPNLGDNGNQLSSDSQTRALQALQTTLQQQEVKLKKIQCQETQPLQRHVHNHYYALRGRPVAAPTMFSSATVRQPDEETVMKSVLGVCHNLAMAVTNVRGKLSSHVLADTANTCNTKQREKPNKRVSNSGLYLKESRRAQFLDDQTIKTGASTALGPGRPERSRPPPALGGLVTHARPPGSTCPCRRKAVSGTSSEPGLTRITSEGDEERAYWLSSNTTASIFQKDAFHISQGSGSTRSSESAPTIGPLKLNSKNESSSRNGQNGTTTPRTERTIHETRPDSMNAWKKEHRSSIVYSLSPLQENNAFKRVPVRKKKFSRTSNSALNMTVIKKMLEDGASNVSLDEKKLMGLALAKLLSAKISKLRGDQRM